MLIIETSLRRPRRGHALIAPMLGLALAVVSAGACSSSSNNADGGTGGKGGTGGTGGGGTGGGGTGGGGDAATGGSGGQNGDGAATDSPASMTLTSSGFTEGMTIPTQFTCAGANTSPALTWTAGPAATMSYALVLTDMANSFVHWVVYDMPSATRMLPASLAADAMLTAPAGAKQVHLALAGAGNGYVGPCPSGALHTYQFEIHALDVATLPGVTTASTSDVAKAQVLTHSIAHGDLSGTSNASRPTDGGGQ